MPPSSSFYAVISGVGPGIGRAAAIRFAKSYPIVVLARSSASYQPIVDEVNASGGRALGYSADVTDVAAVDAAFAQVARELPGAKLAAAVYNPGGGFKFGPFLESKLEDLQHGIASAADGLFIFAQKTIPQLLDAVATSPHPPSLIVTGATASVRGSAKFGMFATGKFAQRALTQSLAREFAPKGVHVALAIIDGAVDIPGRESYVANGGVEDGKIKPEAIGETYWSLHTQHRSCFTQELDIRPYVEKF